MIDKSVQIPLKVIISLMVLILWIGCDNKPIYKAALPDKSLRNISDSVLSFHKHLYRFDSISSHWIFVTDKFDPEELDHWSSEEKMKVKKIIFEQFDTIPIAFDQFPNVETINLYYLWQDTYVPDIFPNLKRIELFGNLIIDKNARFKKTLTEIDAEKSEIKSISSFNELPNLRKIDMQFSKFSPFPTDLNKLQNLEEIVLGAYRGELDVSDLRLSDLKQLKKAIFHTYSKSKIIGFPKDILDINRDIELEIVHPKLTKEQQIILKQFKQSH